MADAVPLRVAAERARADEWVLVLLSEGLEARVQATPEGFVLWVPPAELERAERALAAYDLENPPRPAAAEGARFEPVRGSAPLNTALALVGALLAFFVFATGPRDPQVDWFARGSADAERIVDGEIWRAVTALTLHADLPHVVANALSGAFFFTAAGRVLGAGLGFAAALAAGTAGNLVNAAIHGSGHDAVGASTAVFGAVGVLAGTAVVRRRRAGSRGSRLLAPAAAALGILAMLGTGGERVDLWAHLFGLACGLAVGVAAARAAPRRPGRLGQCLWGTAAALSILYAWGIALG